jgi:hypothetical protein
MDSPLLSREKMVFAIPRYWGTSGYPKKQEEGEKRWEIGIEERSQNRR